MTTVKHDGVDICSTYDLKLQNGVNIGYPELIVNTVQIPDADMIDITTNQSYGRRQIEWPLIIYREAGRDDVINSAQAYVNAWNGKRCEISFTWLEGKHFNGRVAASELVLLDNEHGIINMIADCDAYMYSDEENTQVLSAGDNSVIVEGLSVVPKFSNSTESDVTISIGTSEWTISAGSQNVTLHGLELLNGTTVINTTDTVTMSFTERYI